jgi:fatty acid desaturase
MSDKKKKLQKNREEQKRWIIRVAVAFAINGLVIVWLIFGQFPKYAFPVSLIAMCAYALAGALVTRQLQKRDFELSVWRSAGNGGWVHCHSTDLDYYRSGFFPPAHRDARV